MTIDVFLVRLRSVSPAATGSTRAPPVTALDLNLYLRTAGSSDSRDASHPTPAVAPVPRPIDPASLQAHRWTHEAAGVTMPPKAPRGTPFPTQGAVGAGRLLTRFGLARHSALDEQRVPRREQRQHSRKVTNEQQSDANRGVWGSGSPSRAGRRRNYSRLGRVAALTPHCSLSWKQKTSRARSALRPGRRRQSSAAVRSVERIAADSPRAGGPRIARAAARLPARRG